jgi:hypothetical protein
LIALAGLGWALRTRRNSPQKYAQLAGAPIPTVVPVPEVQEG